MECKYVAVVGAVTGVAIAAGVAALSGVSRESGLPPVPWPKPFPAIRRLHARYVYEAQQQADQIDFAKSVSTGSTGFFYCGSVLEVRRIVLPEPRATILSRDMSSREVYFIS